MQRTILGTMQTQSPCPDCHGEGKVISEQCPHCHGEGVERKEEIVTVNIPAGVADGMTLSMSAGVAYLAIGFSMTIGVVFGLYPANKASKLRPIEALHYS